MTDKREGREGPISLSISRKLTTRKDHGFEKKNWKVFCCETVQQYIQVAFLQ